MSQLAGEAIGGSAPPKITLSAKPFGLGRQHHVRQAFEPDSGTAKGRFCSQR
jgi:hypothetical protein